MKNNIIKIGGLVVLQFLLDTVFVYLYREVSPLRAFLIGLGALMVLYLVSVMKKSLMNPLLGSISIFSSALFGALLVQSGLLVSKSALSGMVHVLILILTYFILRKLQVSKPK